MLPLMWVESSVSSDYGSGQPGALKGECGSCLAKEFVDVPMVLSHPFDEVVKLLDEIADLANRVSSLIKERQLDVYIITAEVETPGPRKGQRERLPDQFFSGPPTR